MIGRLISYCILGILLLTLFGPGGWRLGGKPGFTWLAPIQAVADEYNPVRTLLWADDYVDCTGKTTINTRWSTLVGATVGLGKTITASSKCKMLVAGPTAGTAALSLPSGTKFNCQAGATFYLARQYCSTGSYIGAGCSDTATTTDCRGGTCSCDTGSGNSCEFAPSGGSTYTVIQAASSSKDIELSGCNFNVNQSDDYGVCVNGSNAGLPCASSANCTSGYCDIEGRKPSGAGNINVINFSPAVFSTIKDVNIFDHTVGTNAINIGDFSTVENTNTTRFATTTLGHCSGGANEGNACNISFACGFTPCLGQTRNVTNGINVLGQGSKVENSTTAGTLAGVHIGDSSTLPYDVKLIGLTVNPYMASYGTTSTGVYIEQGQQVNIIGAYITGIYSGLKMEATAVNTRLASSALFSLYGPKVIAQNAGLRIDNSYLAWVPMVCSAGPRAGMPCTTLDTARGTGCPTTGSCAAASNAYAVQVGALSSDTKAANISHLNITSSILHSDKTTPLVYFTNPGLRCKSGARIYLTCTTDDTNGTTGCGAGAVGTDGATCGAGHFGCCSNIAIDAFHMASNQCYGSASSCVNLSNLTSSAKTTFSSGSFVANSVDLSSGTGIIYPTSTGNLSGFFVGSSRWGTGTTPSSNYNANFGTYYANSDGSAGVISKGVYGGSSSTAASQTKYMGYAVGGTTESDVAMPMSLAGTIGNLTCEVDTAPGNTITFTVRKNAADTTITCSRTTAGTSCTDTSHTVGVSVGDLISIKVVTGASSGTHFVKCTVSLT